jgi:hypothetical protein
LLTKESYASKKITNFSTLFTKRCLKFLLNNYHTQNTTKSQTTGAISRVALLAAANITEKINKDKNKFNWLRFEEKGKEKKSFDGTTASREAKTFSAFSPTEQLARC